MSNKLLGPGQHANACCPVAWGYHCAGPRTKKLTDPPIKTPNFSFLCIQNLAFEQMRSLSALCCLFILLATAQAWAQGASLSGIIKNYNSQSLYLYSCYQDTLLLADSTLTGENGEFTFPSTAFETEQGMPEAPGMYKVVLQRNQFFYILHDGAPMEIQTVYFASPFYNIATDSLVVVDPSSAGLFYEFQRLQRQLNIADRWLLQMMRLYPLPDPFHIEIEQEYFKRYEAMDSFIQTEVESDSLAMLVAKAFYLPVNPDWKQPDPWRDSIIAFHYFDHFDPAIDFYRYTNILSEKMHIYVKMRVNKKDSYGQPVMDEKLYSGAAIDFVNETAGNTRTYQYCLNYFLKKLDKAHNVQLYTFAKFLTACIL